MALPSSTLLRPLLAPLRSYAAPLHAPLVVGVSGGADSVALLRSLLLVGASVVVAHLDHQLRPESADDAEWVRGLCAELGVECVVGSAPVAQVAQQRGWTIEQAARRLRYDFLARVAKQHRIEHILTAHTRNDQAETVLWQLLRGEAVLSGIAAQRGPIQRPWLSVSRQQIEAALQVWQQPWREDASNQDTHYTRNWLRHQVMPLLHSRFGGLDESLARLARWQAEDDDTLQAAAQFSPHAPLKSQPLALLRRAVRVQLKAANLRFHAQHLNKLAAALHSGQTQHLSLPAQQQISVVGGAFPALELGKLEQHHWPKPDFVAPPSWTLRHRQNGDRIRLSGGTRKLSDVLTDLRVARAQRDQLWLLADDTSTEGGVQWLGTQPPIWAVGAVHLLGADVSPHTASTDETWMDHALEYACAAAKAGEVPVGAVVVLSGQVISGAANRSRELGDMTQHAELAALQSAAQVVGPYLSECTLYVTLEPCPMCLGAMLEARLGRVVYGASNPRAGALGGLSDLLGQQWGHILKVTPAIRAKQAAKLLKSAFAEFRTAKG